MNGPFVLQNTWRGSGSPEGIKGYFEIVDIITEKHISSTDFYWTKSAKHLLLCSALTSETLTRSVRVIRSHWYSTGSISHWSESCQNSFDWFVVTAVSFRNLMWSHAVCREKKPSKERTPELDIYKPLIVVPYMHNIRKLEEKVFIKMLFLLFDLQTPSLCRVEMKTFTDVQMQHWCLHLYYFNSRAVTIKHVILYGKSINKSSTNFF